MWEIYGLSIINELKSRAAFKGMSEFELDILYAQAKAKLWGKIERLTGAAGVAGRGFWHAPAAQLFMAGIRGDGHEYGAGG